MKLLQILTIKSPSKIMVRGWPFGSPEKRERFGCSASVSVKAKEENKSSFFLFIPFFWSRGRDHRGVLLGLRLGLKKESGGVG